MDLYIIFESKHNASEKSKKYDNHTIAGLWVTIYIFFDNQNGAPGLSSSSSKESKESEERKESTSDLNKIEAEENSINNDLNVHNDTNIYASKSGTMYIVADAAMAGGMSGGPLVNIDGEVMGVISLVRADLNALGNYAISSSTIATFLERMGSLYYNTNQKGNTTSTSSFDKNLVLLMENNENGENTINKFRVVLYNDNMNKRERVSKVLQKTLNIEKQKAENIMTFAHKKGRVIVEEFDSKENNNGREEAFSLCEALRREDLLVEVQRFPYNKN